MKRIISIIVAIVLVCTAAIACADGVKVGIGQFAQHGSLDNCYTGFVEGLAEAGFVEGQNLTIELQNAQADMGIAQQIAAQFASAKVDMMVGIATPMAQACFNVAGDIPTIFTAVGSIQNAYVFLALLMAATTLIFAVVPVHFVTEDEAQAVEKAQSTL